MARRVVAIVGPVHPSPTQRLIFPGAPKTARLSANHIELEWNMDAEQVVKIIKDVGTGRDAEENALRAAFIVARSGTPRDVAGNLAYASALLAVESDRLSVRM